MAQDKLHPHVIRFMRGRRDIWLDESISKWQRQLLCDPQTSGGLLVSCTPGCVDSVLAAFWSDGFHQAAVIGSLQAGSAEITVR
jgi:selenide,water dikinase